MFTPASQSRLKDDVSPRWKALGLGVSKPCRGEREGDRGLWRVGAATGGEGSNGNVVAGRR